MAEQESLIEGVLNKNPLEDISKASLKKGESGTPVIVGTSPTKQHANTPTINDVKDIAKQEEEREIETEDIYAENVFVSDEIEFTTTTGDFGTHAKDCIKEAVKGEEIITRNIKADSSGENAKQLAFYQATQRKWIMGDDVYFRSPLDVKTLGVYEITDLVLGGEATQDDLTQILQAYASGKFVTYVGSVMIPQYYKPYQQAGTDDKVLEICSINLDGGQISEYVQITFTKNEDGSLTITLEEI